MPILRTKGSDYLGSGNVDKSRLPGSLLMSGPLNPLTWRNTRIGREAALWQRWRPRALTIRALGSGPMTSGGSYVLCWSPDVGVNFADSGDNNISIALASEKAVMARVDQPSSLSIPYQTTTRWLDTEATPMSSSHGSVAIVLISPPTGVSGNISFPILLHWDVEWQGRKLDIQAGPQGKISPDSGYSDLFTTSDSSFDSTILTFKAHAGGSMVPFHMSAPGAVYTTMGTSTVVYYVDAESQRQEARWFSRVVGFEIPGLVLHTSEEEAKSYQHTGDKQHCIHYKAAGDYVKPSRPVFAVRQLNEDLEAEVLRLREQVRVFQLMGPSQGPLEGASRHSSFSLMSETMLPSGN